MSGPWGSWRSASRTWYETSARSASRCRSPSASPKPRRAGPVLRRVRRGLAPQRRPATAPWNLAREFFARHSPQEPHRVAVCHSWLLDPVAGGPRCGAASWTMCLNSPPVPSRHSDG
ncbi:hypothetical protein [Streptomyces massasporeus]|uniref:hypothetical protein n=1 Tax=Streptomyces massasporeus TaxID=67324 RepID=UPI0033D89F23